MMLAVDAGRGLSWPTSLGPWAGMQTVHGTGSSAVHFLVLSGPILVRTWSKLLPSPIHGESGWS